jgi:NAD(P)-dependent dehydrogenase (short-subunit alcohol dehydrogenase family)
MPTHDHFRHRQSTQISADKNDLYWSQKFLAELSAASDGAAVSVHQGDVARGEDCRRTVREVIDLHGRLDILVNNAGITLDKTVAKTSPGTSRTT